MDSRRLCVSVLGFFVTFFVSPAFAAMTELGQVSVGSQTTANVVIPLTAAQLAVNPIASVHYGIHFATTVCTAVATGCQVSVKFSPKVPGSISDAVVLKDSLGNVVTRSILHGTGLGPMADFNPATVSVRVPSGPATYFSGMTVDQAGRAYFTQNQNVCRLDAGSNTPVVLYTSVNYSGLGAPVVDPAGNLWFSDFGVLKKVDADSGIVSSVVSVSSANFVFDTAANTFVLGSQSTVTRIDATTGVATTVAGGGAAQMSSGDGGPATAATLWACGPLRLIQRAIYSLRKAIIESARWTRLRRLFKPLWVWVSQAIARTAGLRRKLTLGILARSLLMRSTTSMWLTKVLLRFEK